MAILLTARNLGHRYGVRPLFDDVSFTLEDGDRVGLIGPNGAGKSTLLKIVAGALAPDQGDVARRERLRVGYLPQVPSFAEGATVRQAVAEGFVDAGGELGWEQEARVDELLARLELAGGGAGAERPVAQLSGGWAKRVALARALVRDPELLLLDEPTNHLDVEGILWLERFLAGARFATLTVTHDRLFLQRVATRILELDRRNAGGLLDVPWRLRHLRRAQGRGHGGAGAPGGGVAQHPPPGDRVAAARASGAHHQAGRPHPAGARAGRRGRRSDQPQPGAVGGAGFPGLGAQAAPADRGARAGQALRRPPGVRGAGSVDRPRQSDRPARSQRLRQDHAAAGAGGRRSAQRGHGDPRRRPFGGLVRAGPGLAGSRRQRGGHRLPGWRLRRFPGDAPAPPRLPGTVPVPGRRRSTCRCGSCRAASRPGCWWPV